VSSGQGRGLRFKFRSRQGSTVYNDTTAWID
jgi:hypothetical protein